MTDPALVAVTQFLGLLVLAMPLALVAVLGLSSLFARSLSESATSQLVQLVIVTALIASVGVLAIMLWDGRRAIPIDLVHWVAIPQYHFSLKFIFDRLSVPMAILTFLLCGTIGAFASRYMHRERGCNRFFMAYALFVLGMTFASLAATIETLFIGWELVGISSALLVAYFQERPAPVENGLRVWAVYRVSDAALLVAAVVLHHQSGEGDFVAMMRNDAWPFTSPTALTAGQALGAGLLLLIAVAGKSALIPFSGWLPRAMEGPTPSSAVFYGALSVHLGAFLLLRASPIIEASPVLAGIVVTLGLVTALYATLAGRVQSDIKSALSFASLTQVGIIVAEIGIGLRYIALVHILGHACLRTLQFLRAPTLLQDYQQLENAIGQHLPNRPLMLSWLLPKRVKDWCYRFALERGYLDALLNDYLAQPFLRLFRACDGAERRWTQFLSRPREGRRAAEVAGPARSLEEVA